MSKIYARKNSVVERSIPGQPGKTYLSAEKPADIERNRKLQEQRVQDAQAAKEEARRLAESALRIASYQNATKVNYFEEKAKAEANKATAQQNKDILSNPKKYLNKWDAEKQNAKYQPGRDAIGAMTDEQRQALENANALNPRKVPEWVSKAYGEEQGKNIIDAYSNMKKEEEAVEVARKLQEEQEKNRAVMEEQMTKVEAMTPEERKALELYNQMLGKQAFSGAPELYQGAMDDAMSALNGYSNEEIAKMAEALRWSDSAERMEEVKENAREFGHEHPVIGSIGATGSNLIGAVTGPFGYLGEMANQTGQFSTLNPNNMGTAFQQQGAQLQGAVTEDIVGDGSSGIRRGLGYLYQGGMSLADSAARIAAAGPAGSLALAGMGSFSQTMQEASEKGATPAQATIMAAASAGLEVATEKIPLDDWLDIAKGGAQPVTDALLSAFKQAGVEATTEEISLIGGMIVEAAVMKEKSGYNQDIADMVAGGMSYDEAKATKQDDIWREVLDTAIVSGLSGAMSSAGGSIIAGVDEKVQDNRGLESYIAEYAARKAAEADAAKAALEARDSAARQYYDQHPEEMITQEAIERIRGQETTQDTQAPGGLTQADIDQLGAQWANQEVTKEIPPMQPMTNEQIQAAADQVLGADSAKKLNVTDTEIQENIQAVGSMESVKDLTGREFVKGDGLKQRVIDFFGKIGKAYNSRVGEVLLTKKGVKDDFGHGMTNEKAAAFAAVPDVIKNGKVVQYEPNRKGKSYDSVTIVAPVTIGGEPYMMNVIAHRDNGESRFYLHDVYTESDVESRTVPPTSQAFAPDENAHITETGSKADASTGNYGARGAHHPSASNSTISVMEQIWNVKKNDQGNVHNGESTPQVDTSNVSTGEGQKQNTEKKGRAGSRKYNGTAKSQYFENSGVRSIDPDTNAATQYVNENNPELTMHDVHSQRHLEQVARRQTGTEEGVSRQYEKLIQKETFTDQDLITAKKVKSALFRAGDTEAYTAMSMKISEELTKAGQVLRSNQNDMMSVVKSTETSVDHAIDQIDKLNMEDAVFKPEKQGTDPKVRQETFDAWKKRVKQDLTDIGVEIENVADGDADAMKDIIRQISKARGTTAWFGTSDRLARNGERVLNTLKFDDLKTIANAQIASMADDFRKRTKTEIAMGLRKQSMLSSLKTINRNLIGNSVAGGISSLSDSSAGQAFDILLSKATGKRTIGNDMARSGTYLKSAKNAMDFASLCVELNIPIETDIEGLEANFNEKNGNKWVGKTFRSNSKNPVLRLLYAYQKYMSYALEVSDKIFEGGTNAAVKESLGKLKNSGLSKEETADIAEFEANRRTFKDATWTDEKGAEHGSTLSRTAQGVKNGTFVPQPARGAYQIGMDVVIPFASVPMNVAQTGIDYSPVGFSNGLKETISIIKEAKAGKDIDAVRQHKAASDLGRGMTGIAMVGLFAAAASAGILKISNDKDKDKRALDQADGLSGAQLNLSALSRGFSGGSTEWQSGDIIMGMDSLEPFNTQMYLGSQLINDESISALLLDATTVPAALQAILDSPMMTGISEIFSLWEDVADAESGTEALDAVAEYAGDYAGSYIPQFIRQGGQLIDGYYRDTRGNSTEETAWNNIKSGLPWASRTLPVKYSGLGEAQERPGFMGTFVDPFNFRRYSPNEINQEMNNLSERTGDKSIYPDRQAPMTITYTDASGEKHEDYRLTGSQREAYQKQYGETNGRILGELINSDAYRALTDAEKAKAIDYVTTYSREKGRSDVLPGYETGEIWTQDIEEGGEIPAILNKVTESVFTDAFDSLTKDWDYGRDTAGSIADLERAYSVYDGMDADVKDAFRENNGGRIDDFLTAKENGVDTETFAGLYKQYKDLYNNKDLSTGDKANDWATVLAKAQKEGAISREAEAALKDSMGFRYSMEAKTEHLDELNSMGLSPDTSRFIVDTINNLTGTGGVDKQSGEKRVTNEDKYRMIASLNGKNGLTTADIDKVMKEWMTDYDPTAKSPDKIELKYDYARKDMGLSPSQFAWAKTDYSKYSTKEDRERAWKNHGIPESKFKELHKLLGGSDKKFNARLVELYG